MTLEILLICYDSLDLVGMGMILGGGIGFEVPCLFKNNGWTFCSRREKYLLSYGIVLQVGGVI